MSVFAADLASQQYDIVTSASEYDDMSIALE